VVFTFSAIKNISRLPLVQGVTWVRVVFFGSLAFNSVVVFTFSAIKNISRLPLVQGVTWVRVVFFGRTPIRLKLGLQKIYSLYGFER